MGSFLDTFLTKGFGFEGKYSHLPTAISRLFLLGYLMEFIPQTPAVGRDPPPSPPVAVFLLLLRGRRKHTLEQTESRSAS